MKEVRVIGVPRSGTNLVKYLVEKNTDIRCYFHLGWWKHAIIPPLMTQTEVHKDQTATIVMFREPLLQLASFFNFTVNGGGALSGAATFEKFISSPLHMYPTGDIEYFFSTPIEYWLQYYHAALHWKHPNKFLIELQDLQSNPDMLADIIAIIFPEIGRMSNLELPTAYLQRNPDRHISELQPTHPDKSVENERQAVQSLARSIAPSPLHDEKMGPASLMYEKLRLARFRKR